MDLSGDWAEGTTRMLTVTLKGDGPDGAGAMGSVDLSREFPDGRTDLGDLVLDAAPIFAAGRVVDPGGTGVAGAELFLQVREGPGDESGRGWWNPVWDFDHRADEEGFFEVRGRFAGEAFRIGAKADGMAGKAVDFVSGDRSVVVQLTAAGSIRGLVLLDEDVPPDELHVRAAPRTDGSDVYTYDDVNSRLDEEGGFAIGGLLPGAYELQVRVDGYSDSLHVIEGVVARGGLVTDVPAIDLRGRLHVYRFTIVTEDPDEQVQGNLEVRPTGASEEEGGQSRWFHEREVVVISEHPALDVEVSARGYRKEVLAEVRGDTEVHLRRGIPVRVLLRGDARIPDPPHYFKAVLVSAEGNGWDGIDWGAPCFDEDREIVVRAQTGGRMRVVWVLEKRTGNSALATTGNVEPQQFVEIADVPGEQVVSVTLTQEQLDELLGGL